METCNPGCDQPTKYKCKKGYKYDSATKSCKSAAVPLITIKITNKPDMQFDNIALNTSGTVSVLRTSTTTTSFTTTTSDNSTHKVQLRFTLIHTESHTGTFGSGNSGNNGLISGGGNSGNNGLISGGGNISGGNANRFKAKSVANNISNNASANKPSTITIGENEKATTYYYHTTKGLSEGQTSTETTYSCSMTLIIDRKKVQSFVYGDVSSGCNDLRKDLASLNYGEVYSYDGYNVKFENSSEQIITKNTCATWDLKTETEANCGAGEIFKQDTTHKTDDNGDKCGTCVKDNSQCYGTANIHLAYYLDWPSNESVLKGRKSIELGFYSVDKVSTLTYKGGISQTSVTLDGSHTYYRVVDPKLDDISTRCYYKVITKEKYEKTTGLTLKTSGRPNSISDLSFYGSVWRDWPSNNVVTCKGDWVAIMACFTTHGEGDLNQNSYCNQYDSHYGSCYGDAQGGTSLPSEIRGGFSDQKSCCVKFGTR